MSAGPVLQLTYSTTRIIPHKIRGQKLGHMYHTYQVKKVDARYALRNEYHTFPVWSTEHRPRGVG